MVLDLSVPVKMGISNVITKELSTLVEIMISVMLKTISTERKKNPELSITFKPVSVTSAICCIILTQI